MPNLNRPLKLKNDLIIPNRLAKAAMSENIADRSLLPDKAIYRLYERFGSSGAGLLITGNIIIDKTALGEPNNVVLENATNSYPFFKRV